MKFTYIHAENAVKVWATEGCLGWGRCYAIYSTLKWVKCLCTCSCLIILSPFFEIQNAFAEKIPKPGKRIPCVVMCCPRKRIEEWNKIFFKQINIHIKFMPSKGLKNICNCCFFFHSFILHAFSRNSHGMAGIKKQQKEREIIINKISKIFFVSSMELNWKYFNEIVKIFFYFRCLWLAEEIEKETQTCMLGW